MNDTKLPAGGLQVRQAECHDTCLDIEGPNGHIANVNPVGYTNPQVWRVDCDSCTTCIRSGFETKKDALEAAKEHVKVSSEKYWLDRYGKPDNDAYITPYPVACTDCSAPAGEPCQTGCPNLD